MKKAVCIIAASLSALSLLLFVGIKAKRRAMYK